MTPVTAPTNTWTVEGEDHIWDAIHPPHPPPTAPKIIGVRRSFFFTGDLGARTPHPTPPKMAPRIIGSVKSISQCFASIRLSEKVTRKRMATPYGFDDSKWDDSKWAEYVYNEETQEVELVSPPKVTPPKTGPKTKPDPPKVPPNTFEIQCREFLKAIYGHDDSDECGCSTCGSACDSDYDSQMEGLDF